GYLLGTFGTTAIQTGKLCGAVDARALGAVFFPQLADALSAEIKRRGTCAAYFAYYFDCNHSCDTDPACVPSSAAQCHCISVSEVENNSIVRALFSPDLDLDPNKTNPFVTDRCDPTYYNDALSVGVGFGANQAAFPLP